MSEVHWHKLAVDTTEIVQRRGHHGLTVWFTGLSGSGKSTLANSVSRKLFDRGIDVVVLDADNVRHGLNSDLGFSDDDRSENMRRLGEVAALMSSYGLVVLVAAISPFRKDRDIVRMIQAREGVVFLQVHVATSLEECERRDTKGLYRRVRAGGYSGLSGVDAPFEKQDDADIVMATENRTVADCTDELIDKLLLIIK